MRQHGKAVGSGRKGEKRGRRARGPKVENFGAKVEMDAGPGGSRSTKRGGLLERALTVDKKNRKGGGKVERPKGTKNKTWGTERGGGNKQKRPSQSKGATRHRPQLKHSTAKRHLVNARYASENVDHGVTV